MKNSEHPIQPIIVDPEGTYRFKENKIVSWMLEQGRLGNKFDMNAIAIIDFPREDREQFAQLIGYSVSGACDLSYMSDRVCNFVLKKSEKIRDERKNT